jgi:peptidoglycan glycosyltransferase
MSPFQGVNLATTVANGGEMMRLSMVSSVKDEEGEIYRGPTSGRCCAGPSKRTSPRQ